MNKASDTSCTDQKSPSNANAEAFHEEGASEAEVEAKPCKHCGFKVSYEDDDFLYPTTHARDEYSANCYETGGGCAHYELAESAEAVLERWNAPLQPGEQPHRPPEVPGLRELLESLGA